MLRLPQDLAPTLRAEARELAPRFGLEAKDVDTLLDPLLLALPATSATSIDQFVSWLTVLRQHPLAEQQNDRVQELLTAVQSRLLSTFAMSFPSVRGAIDELGQEEVATLGTRRRRNMRREEIQDHVRDYLTLAGAIGPAAVIDALISAGQIPESDRESYTGILTQYLGRGAPAGGYGPTLQLDEEFLENPTIAEFLTHVLEVQVFRLLIEAGADQHDFRDPNTASASLEWLTATLNSSLDSLWDQAKVHRTSHAGLRERVAETFLGAATLPIPDCFRQSIKNHHGSDCAFPSFAQRIAVQRLLTHGDQYLCLNTGRGKTAIPFIAYEIRKAQSKKPEHYRFVGIYPPNMTAEVANRLVPQAGMRDVARYYLDGQAPGVGVITSATTDEQFAAAIDQPIVLVSDTMLSATRQDQVVVDALVAQRRQEVTYDELHRINGGKSWTQNATRIIEVSEHASGTSATPQLAGSLAGVRAASTALARTSTAEERWEGGERGRVRPDIATSLQEFRTQLRQILFNPEKPSNWYERFTQIRWQLNPAEERVMQRIIRDQEMTIMERHVMAELALQCPWLFANGTKNEDPTLLTTLTTDLAELCENAEVHSCLVGMDWLRKGIFERHEDFPNGESFVERVQAWVNAYNQGNPARQIELHIIHGGVPQRQRDDILHAGRTAKERHVFALIVAQRECVGIGQDMRFIDDLRHIGHPSSLAKFDQFSGRANRAGRDDVHLTTYYAGRTVQAGKRHLAHRRHQEEQIVLASDQPVTERQFRRIYDPGTSEEAVIQNGRLRGCLEHPDERHERLQQQLHGKGTTYLHRSLGKATQYDDWYSQRIQRDQLGSGDAQRFLAARVLEQSRRNIGGPIVTLGLGGMTLTEDLRRLDPQGQHQLIECAVHQRTADAGSQLVPLQHPTIPAAQVVVQAPQLFQHIHAGRKSTNTNAAKLEWGTAQQVVLTGLEFYAWSNNESLVERTDRQTERGRALVYARRLLKPEGVLTIHIPAGACTHAEFERLCTQVLPALNMRVLNDTSGTVRSSDNANEPASSGFVVTAMALPNNDDFKPTWKHARGVLSTDALTFTPSNQQSEAQRRALRPRGKLPERLVHQQFAVQPRSRGEVLEYHYQYPLPQRHEQEALLAQLSDAVAHIRRLAPDAPTFTANRERILPQLQALGIEWDGGVTQPRFVLESLPQDVFRPYDAIWNESEAGE